LSINIAYDIFHPGVFTGVGGFLEIEHGVFLLAIAKMIPL